MERTPDGGDPSSDPSSSTGTSTNNLHTITNNNNSNTRDNSPFKDLMQTLDRPLTADFTSPPKSADYYKKTSFFQVKKKPWKI